MTPPANVSSRIEWMDLLRGSAILLLLVWHASAVPEQLGISKMPAPVLAANSFFLPYRMPTLMFLSGLLLAKSLRKPLPEYLAGKIRMIAWPYLIWVVVAKFVFLELPGLPWWHWRAWYATSYLWFLFFIFCYYVAAPLVRNLPAWVPVLGAAAIGLLLPLGGNEERMAYFAIFFFLGDAVARRPELLPRLMSGWRAIVWVTVALAFGFVSAIQDRALLYDVQLAPLSVAGILGFILLCQRVPAKSQAADAVRRIGRSSVVYYTSHYPVMVLVSRALGDDAGFWSLTLVNFLVAVLVGVLLTRWQDVRPWRWLFQGPGWISSLVGHVARTRSRSRH